MPPTWFLAPRRRVWLPVAALGATVAAVDTAFFQPLTSTPDGDQTFLGTSSCTGPWADTAMHGGPPSALLVRACERATGRDDLAALRASIDFLGPVPVGEVTVSARVIRPGRTVTLCEATMQAGGRPVLVARVWSVKLPEPDDDGTPGIKPDDRSVESPQQCPEAMQGPSWDFGYARAIEWRLLHGDPHGPGMAGVWARPRIPLVEGEPISSLARAVLIADSGNGVSASLDWNRWSFVNIDLSVHLARPVEGEWVLLDAASRISTTGSGLATSVLRDQVGVVGAGAQTLVVSARR
jgi:Thioesterase-like superfamily